MSDVFGPTNFFDGYEQIGRRITLQSAHTSLELGTVGARIAALRVGGIDLVERTPSGHAPIIYNGVHLAPWAGAVRNGAWTFEGETLQLTITDPRNHSALHGLVSFSDFVIRDNTADSATLGTYVAPQRGWPIPLDLEAQFTATPDGIRVEHRIRNLGDHRVPYATGAHPYLRIGSYPVEVLDITVVGEQIEACDARVSNGSGRTKGELVEVGAEVRIGASPLDALFVGGSRIGACLRAPDGSTLQLFRGPEWKWLRVLYRDDWPDEGGAHRRAVAVMPMTAPPDALTSGKDLIWVEPGEKWSGSWGLRYQHT